MNRIVLGTGDRIKGVIVCVPSKTESQGFRRSRNGQTR